MTETAIDTTEPLRARIRLPSAGVGTLVNAWLSGALAGEVFVFAVLPAFRTVEPARTVSDLYVAAGGALLSLAILAVLVYIEVGSD